MSAAFVPDSGDSWSENFLLLSPMSAFNVLMYIYSPYPPPVLSTSVCHWHTDLFLRNSSPKNEISVIIHLSSWHSRRIWLYSYRVTKKEKFSRMLTVLFSIQWKSTMTRSWFCLFLNIFCLSFLFLFLIICVCFRFQSKHEQCIPSRLRTQHDTPAE